MVKGSGSDELGARRSGSTTRAFDHGEGVFQVGLLGESGDCGFQPQVLVKTSGEREMTGLAQGGSRETGIQGSTP
ncbi:hypothetical protein [Streptomyces sp. NPDC013187]|uniref:hypothetical protein n=1 Tax=Streptomyces sp. NPDC013187 TaxID=3364865 RepID=UPI0036A0CD42